jgi:TPR repeat protein
MKRLLCVIAFGMSGLVSAGQLEDANAFLQGRAYDKALPLYTQLADAGNPEAQFRLGEMYWYGDGTAPDSKQATAWMQKAVASGHAGARESLAILQQRETRAADIAYWTSGYQGDDLVSGKFNCADPATPVISTSAADIRTTEKAYLAWQLCYKKFVANLGSVTPLGKRIPADVARLMTPREATQAVAHLNDVYTDINMHANEQAASIGAAYAQWEKASSDSILAANKARKLEWDNNRAWMDERQMGYIQAKDKVVKPVLAGK